MRDKGETITLIARVLCENAGYDPDYLEPGNVIVHPLDDLEGWRDENGTSLDALADSGVREPDGRNAKGEPCHFLWRGKIEDAQNIYYALFEEPEAA